MTETNLAGGPVPPTESARGAICVSCRLAWMMETGVMSAAVDGAHSACEGTTADPCGCHCDYATRHQCKQCGRKRPAETLDSSGECVDRRDCSNTILAAAAARRAERTQKALVSPTKRPGGGSTASKPRPCTCGCGETTGGGLYRPGHDARHVSQLTAKVRAGEITETAASDQLPSQKLRDKLTKALG